MKILFCTITRQTVYGRWKKISGFVVSEGNPDYQGAWFKTEKDAENFLNFIKIKI